MSFIATSAAPPGMLRLSETRRELTIVGDQIGGPTPAASIAFAAVKILEALQREPAKSGTYHFAGAPDVSWAGFARDIFRQAGREIRIADIPTSDYPTPAKRPANSRLNCSSLAAFGLERPDWREGVSDALKKLGVISCMPGRTSLSKNRLQRLLMMQDASSPAPRRRTRSWWSATSCVTIRPG